ncbi:hypothetical protein [Stutzerimonas kunmingensis]|uniref:hypothetical protein n=1 Tax=Stutzerimonas kunmingensis TaxID=1211807 RepID=UPI00241D6726|nr:hypothetical protein [Stutzerimonas kunmingensis]
MSDVEIWLGQKAKLSWFLRSNAEIERFSSSREEALSETDFFNRIGHELTFKWSTRAGAIQACDECAARR